MNRPGAILLPVLACLCCSCSRQADLNPKTGKEVRGDIVAAVGEEQISAAEFQSAWNRRLRGAPGLQANPEQRERLLEELIRAKAALVKARAAGMDRDPETTALVDRLIVARYTEAEFARRFAEDPSVDEKEIASFYEASPIRFRVPAAVRAGFIWLTISQKADTEQRTAMRARAEQVHAEAIKADAATFKTLVQQHSEDQATRYTGGDTGWLREGELASCDPAVAAAAFKLQNPGEIAPLLATSNGFYIVRLLERQSPGVRPLAEVLEAIRYQLLQQKRQQREHDFFEEMKRGLAIVVNHDLLNSIQAPAAVSNSAPPALPGS